MKDRSSLLLVANWKMHPAPAGFDTQDSPYRSRKGVDVVVLPTFLDLKRCIDAKLAVGAQCGRAEPSGAFTGDVSMVMLAEIGCTFVLCGHSDRRRFHGEKDEDVARQTVAALDAGLTPIVCIGETAEERAAGKAEEVVTRQLHHIFSSDSKFKIQNSKFILAYEPVWAISRGDPSKSADTPEHAQSMHAFIRSLLTTHDSQLKTSPILYGASMKPANTRALLSQPDIDGGLIGGASLDPSAFRAIVETCPS